MNVKHRSKIDNKEYEIRSRRTEEGFEVAIFAGEARVGGLYSTTYETAFDSQVAQGTDGEEMLIDQAMSDIDAGIVKG